MTSIPPILDVRDLDVRFALRGGPFWRKRPQLHAVRAVSFALGRGTTLGIVGESGSGKTTTAMAAIRLVTATGGQVLFQGQDLLRLDKRRMRQMRRDMQVVFQDPYSSLNPRQRVGTAVREPMDLMNVGSAAERLERVRELFSLVGLRPDHMALFPHQFSGGQRQRVSIARALSTTPSLLVCDEPVSALDVAIQAQILNLLRRLQEQLNLSYLFISHDLGVVQYICDEIAVMYLGRIVERARREDLFTRPQHPYTASLLAAAPSLARRKADPRRDVQTLGEPPGSAATPHGCPYAPRCPRARPICLELEPALREDAGRAVACHFPLDR